MSSGGKTPQALLDARLIFDYSPDKKPHQKMPKTMQKKHYLEAMNTIIPYLKPICTTLL